MKLSDLILVVDDDRDSCLIIKEFFKTWDYRVEIAEDGKQGWEKFLEFKPRLVILDIRMPIMDGYEMLKRIRDMDAATPVIIVSAQTFINGADECLKRGATDALSKPIELKALEEKVQRCLNNG